jgi:hypothetical protein
MKRFLIVMNIVFMGAIIFLGFSKSTVFQSVETKSLVTNDLIIQSERGRGNIRVGFEDGVAVMKLSGKEGKGGIEFICGDKPSIMVKNRNGVVVSRLEVGDGDEGVMLFNDIKGATRLAMDGGNSGGIYLRNGDGKTVGSWTILKDSGVGFGLAQDNGMPSAIIRGGENPSVAFFGRSGDPLCAVGVSQDIPHLLVAGNIGSEGVLIHGGKPTGMMMVDEEGMVKIFISKEGIFQGKGNEDKRGVEESKRILTLKEEVLGLFPDAKKKQR